MNRYLAVALAVATRVPPLLGILAMLLLVSTEASAVPIVFSAPSFTLVDDTVLGSIVTTTILDVTDENDPNPSVASFELRVSGEFQNRRSSFTEEVTPQGVLRSEQFNYIRDIDLSVELTGILDAQIAESSGLSSAAASVFGDGAFFDFEFGDPAPFPGEPNAAFDSPTAWSARLLVSVFVAPGVTAGFFGVTSTGLVSSCEALDGTIIDCNTDGATSEGAFAPFSFTSVPAPPSNLLVAWGCLAAAVAGRGAQDRSRR